MEEAERLEEDNSEQIIEMQLVYFRCSSFALPLSSSVYLFLPFLFLLSFNHLSRHVFLGEDLITDKQE